MGDQTEKKLPTIVVHRYGRSKHTPSLSPFPLKLETFLRMAKVPYEVDFKKPMSKKGKTPWMTADGVDVADSYFCIKYLKKNFDIDVNKHLTEQDKALAVSFRTLVEDHLYWILLHWRANKENYAVLKTHMQGSAFFKNIMVPMIRLKMDKVAHAQGMGRHSWDEVIQFAKEDLQALSTFLGSKKYLMGDEPSEIDCTVFGMLCQLIYNQVEPMLPDWFEEGPGKTLKEYTFRIKEEFWPDWDDWCLKTKGTSEASAEVKNEDKEEKKEENKEEKKETKEEKEREEKMAENEEEKTDSKEEPSN